MEIRDITERAFETLTLLQELEEYVDSGAFGDINEALENFEESLTEEEHEAYVMDFYLLDKAGYIKSDIEDENIEDDTFPYIDGMTPKGCSILKQYEQELELEKQKKNARKNGKEKESDKNYSFITFNFNPSLVGGLEFVMNKSGINLNGLLKKIRKF